MCAFQAASVLCALTMTAPVVSPAGIFRSASEASRACGVSRSVIRRLAARRLGGWRYASSAEVIGESFVEDLPDNMQVKAGKPVITPAGEFRSALQASAALGISHQAVVYRIKRGIPGWSYQEGVLL